MLNKNLAVLALGLFSVPAMAGVPCLEGENNVTCVTEREADTNTVDVESVEYTVENNSGDRLFAFGVTNDTPFDKSNPIYTSNSNEGWDDSYISQSTWDSNERYFFFSETSESKPTNRWISGEKPEESAEEGATYLGSFAELFGTEDDYVAFFWNRTLAGTPLNDGVTLGSFFLGAPVNSDVSTFGVNGNVISTSVVSSVPEPETYAMFLAGLGLLGFASRKRNA